MSLWLKRLVPAVVLAVMPLQGIAATLAVLPCHAEQPAGAVVAHHDGLGTSPQHDRDASNTIRPDAKGSTCLA